MYIFISGEASFERSAWIIMKSNEAALKVEKLFLYQGKLDVNGNFISVYIYIYLCTYTYICIHIHIHIFTCCSIAVPWTEHPEKECMKAFECKQVSLHKPEIVTAQLDASLSNPQRYVCIHMYIHLLYTYISCLT